MISHRIARRCLLSVAWLVPISPAYSTVAGDYRVVRTFDVAAEPACMPALTRAPNGNLLVAFSTEWEPFPQGGALKLVVMQGIDRSKADHPLIGFGAGMSLIGNVIEPTKR